MDLQIEKCITANRQPPASMVAKLLRNRHPLTYVLLDLQLLEEEVNKLGEETATASYLSGEELVLLSRLTSPKRKPDSLNRLNLKIVMWTGPAILL